MKAWQIVISLSSTLLFYLFFGCQIRPREAGEISDCQIHKHGFTNIFHYCANVSGTCNVWQANKKKKNQTNRRTNGDTVHNTLEWTQLASPVYPIIVSIYLTQRES